MTKCDLRTRDSDLSRRSPSNPDRYQYKALSHVVALGGTTPPTGRRTSTDLHRSTGTACDSSRTKSNTSVVCSIMIISERCRGARDSHWSAK